VPYPQKSNVDALDAATEKK